MLLQLEANSRTRTFPVNLPEETPFQAADAQAFYRALLGIQPMETSSILDSMGYCETCGRWYDQEDPCQTH